MRLVPTNTIYMQKIAMGLSDIGATCIFYGLKTRLGVVKSFVILFGLLTLASLSLVITLAVSGAEH